MLESTETTAVELSALRDRELRPLMSSLRNLELEQFQYVSVHVPSKFKLLEESEVSAALRSCIELEIPIVIHPDVISEPKHWHGFDHLLCIENMDKRKRTGRTVEELEQFFSLFPNATFCLDLAHARQVDSTMTEARRMLRRFGDRLRQLHISEIDAVGHHHGLSLASILGIQGVSRMVDASIPIIIESMVAETEIEREILSVRRALASPQDAQLADWGALA
jgi:hypothetical protein